MVDAGTAQEVGEPNIANMRFLVRRVRPQSDYRRADTLTARVAWVELLLDHRRRRTASAPPVTTDPPPSSPAAARGERSASVTTAVVTIITTRIAAGTAQRARRRALFVRSLLEIV